MDEYSREPCPHRIYADAGSAFAMGIVGGSVFHAIKGSRSAASGQKLMGAFREIRMRSPVTGSQFAAWGGMFSVIDCGLVAVRQKEDPFNSIAAGGLTGGLLCARMGLGTALVSAGFGALILTMIEGVGVLMNRMLVAQQDGGSATPEDPKALSEKEKSNVHSPNFGSPSAGISGMTAQQSF